MIALEFEIKLLAQREKQMAGVMEKTIELKFRGYWRAKNASGIPNESGIFCVYLCTYNSDSDTVTLHKLLDVGQSEKVQDAIYETDLNVHWFKKLDEGQELCFSFAPVHDFDESGRKKIVASLINFHGTGPEIEKLSLLQENPEQLDLVTKGTNYFLDRETHNQKSMQSMSN